MQTESRVRTSDTSAFSFESIEAVFTLFVHSTIQDSMRTQKLFDDGLSLPNHTASACREEQVSRGGWHIVKITVS